MTHSFVSEPWWPELLSLKDELPMRALAARFGVGVAPLAGALLATGTSRRPWIPGEREAETGGAGLGLSLTAGIVRRAGGHIELDSKPGVGTSLRVYLPLVASPGVQADGGRSAPEPAALTPPERAAG